MTKIKTKPTTRRLTIDLPSDLHQNLKVRAALHDLSIKDYVIELVLKHLVKNIKNFKKMHFDLDQIMRDFTMSLNDKKFKKIK